VVYEEQTFGDMGWVEKVCGVVWDGGRRRFSITTERL
jgi:hypothetical protein